MQQHESREKYSNGRTWQACLATRLEHTQIGLFLDVVRRANRKRLRSKKPQAPRKNTRCKKTGKTSAARRMERKAVREKAAGHVRRYYWAKPEVLDIVKGLTDYSKLVHWTRLRRLGTLLHLLFRLLVVIARA